ncbi:MAG: addiction module protein [Proteobacteria bacterium]|nr:addiction module protein [Pseudomonadota bacterium]
MIAQDQIEKLSAAERLALIEQLWDSLSDAAVPLPDAQRRELDRRLQTIDEERPKAVSWEHIQDDLDARKR